MTLSLLFRWFEKVFKSLKVRHTLKVFIPFQPILLMYSVHIGNETIFFESKTRIFVFANKATFRALYRSPWLRPQTADTLALTFRRFRSEKIALFPV